MTGCRVCGCQLSLDAQGTLVDDTGSSVCAEDGSGGLHQLDDADSELLGLAVLDITGVTDHVRGMPDVL